MMILSKAVRLAQRYLILAAITISGSVAIYLVWDLALTGSQLKLSAQNAAVVSTNRTVSGKILKIQNQNKKMWVAKDGGQFEVVANRDFMLIRLPGLKAASKTSTLPYPPELVSDFAQLKEGQEVTVSQDLDENGDFLISNVRLSETP